MIRKYSMLEAAKAYAALGWPVFPVHSPEGSGCSCGDPDCSSVAKHPCIQAWPTQATTDPETIRCWWRFWPEANIGVYVGGAHLLVIDVDVERGGSLDDLPLCDADRITPTVNTGGGGLHRYYSAPPDLDISNSNQRLPQGIDVRTGRSGAVAPPSRHSSGRRYAWQPGRAPWDVSPHPLPEALLPLLKIKSETPGLNTVAVRPGIDRLFEVGSRHPYVQKALAEELDRLAHAEEGNRNNTLNEVAFILGQFVGAGLLARSEAEALLQAAARTIDLGELETQRTIESGLDAGISHPRRAWPDLN